MSYGVAAALQAAVYQRLVSALPDVAVFDAPPEAAGSGSFVLIGPEEALDASDKTGGGALHRVQISVISDAAGFLTAKEIAVRVSDALTDQALVLARGRVVLMRFVRAVARRLGAGATRRIDLRFDVRVED